MHLYMSCLSIRKQETRNKRVQVMVEQPMLAGDLDSAREIVEIKPPQSTLTDPRQATAIQPTEEEFEEILDPDEPLYGLEQRLANLQIATEVKQIIKTKLKQADLKIKDNLRIRQEALEQKLLAPPEKKKK
jgi:hypothetical protein